MKFWKGWHNEWHRTNASVSQSRFESQQVVTFATSSVELDCRRATHMRLSIYFFSETRCEIQAEYKVVEHSHPSL